MKLTSVKDLQRISSVLFVLSVVICGHRVSGYVNPLRNTSDTEVIGAEPGTRTGKFLFDTLFGIEETSYNSDDDEPASAAQNTLKSCDCGEYSESCSARR